MRILQSGCVDGYGLQKISENFLCEACVKGKQQRLLQILLLTIFQEGICFLFTVRK